MRLHKEFEVDAPRERAVEISSRDETLIGLFPDPKASIVESRGSRRTVVSHYEALGREGEATFHFDTLPDGNVAFGKVCDGHVWKRLEGMLRFEAFAGGTRVCVELEGATKGLVPEFTIRGPMEGQIEQMARSLRRLIENEAS
jgi:hypothetical protein